MKMRLVLFIPIITNPSFLIADDSLMLYKNISIANLSDSFQRIRDVTLYNYEFKHDSVAGRRQIGVLGLEAEKYFPESIDIVERYTVPSKIKGEPPNILHNFPIVDKNTIFMHGVGAIKELIGFYNRMEIDYNQIDENLGQIKDILKELTARVADENDLLLIEQASLKSAEIDFYDKRMQMENIQAEEFRNTMDVELEERKKLTKYQEELALRSMKYELELAEKLANESIRIEKELLEKREKIRSDTTIRIQEKRLAHEKDLDVRKAELEIQKIQAEMEAKVETERANEEIKLKQLEKQAAMDTKRIVETVRTVSNQLTKLVADVLSQPMQVAILAGVVLAFISLYHIMVAVATALRQFLQSRLGRPSLLRETNAKWSLPWGLPSLVASESSVTGLKQIERIFENVVLDDQDRSSVINLALTTRNTHRSGAPFRHILLHGHPGTGKTLIARCLAAASGLDYAIMSGGDVGPLGEDAVTQLHGLFKWASRSPRGLLVFIDEAEAFLASRSQMGTDDAHLRHALNALLYQTGTQSRKFMLVLATNRPEDLDPAILDRMDVSLHIKLPGLEQRAGLVKLYMKAHVMALEEASRKGGFFYGRGANMSYSVDPKCYSEASILSIAKDTEGFSGREIAKLMISVQHTLLLAEKKNLTCDMLKSSVRAKLEEHREREEFVKDGLKFNYAVDH